jgi:hypothetical protein
MAAWSGRTAGAENEVVTAVTLIRGLEGREEELEAHLLSLSAPTRAEPGCVMYDLYRSPGVEPLPAPRGLGEPRRPRGPQSDSSHSPLVRKEAARGMVDGNLRLETRRVARHANRLRQTSRAPTSTEFWWSGSDRS